MARFFSGQKTKLDFIIVCFSGWSFWLIFFGFYIISNLINLLLGSFCNLGIINNSLVCGSKALLNDGSWAGVTSINPLLSISLLLFFLIMYAYYKKGILLQIKKIDYFDLGFKFLCIIAMTLGMTFTFFVVGTVLLIYFLIHIFFLAFKKTKSSNYPSVYSNKKQVVTVFLVISLLFFVEASGKMFFMDLFGELDKKSYIQCCNEEMIIDSNRFQTTKNAPLCIYERNRYQAEVCKINNPLEKSIYPEFVNSSRARRSLPR